MIMNSYAKALEVVPRQLADNAGIDSTDILNLLRKAHATSDTVEGNKWMGVDVLQDGITNTLDSGVWEPAANKLNSLAAATEAACCILSIDETVRNPQSEQAGAASGGVGYGPGGGGGGGGGGRTGKMVSEAMGGGGMQGMMGKGKMRKGVKMFKGKGGA